MPSCPSRARRAVRGWCWQLQTAERTTSRRKIAILSTAVKYKTSLNIFRWRLMLESVESMSNATDGALKSFSQLIWRLGTSASEEVLSISNATDLSKTLKFLLTDLTTGNLCERRSVNLSANATLRLTTSAIQRHRESYRSMSQLNLFLFIFFSYSY